MTSVKLNNISEICYQNNLINLILSDQYYHYPIPIGWIPNYDIHKIKITYIIDYYILNIWNLSKLGHGVWWIEFF